MSVSLTVTTSAFQKGDSVSAYKLLDQPELGLSPLRGTAADTKTVSSTNTIAFTTLTADTEYLLALAAVANVQTLTVDATAGNFRLSYGGYSTPPLKFNITAANLKTELLALTSLGGTTIATITGGPGDSGGTTPYIITFGSTLAANTTPLTVVSGVAANASTALANVSGGGATVTVANTTPGVAAGTPRVQLIAPHS